MARFNSIEGGSEPPPRSTGSRPRQGGAKPKAGKSAKPRQAAEDIRTRLPETRLRERPRGEGCNQKSDIRPPTSVRPPIPGGISTSDFLAIVNGTKPAGHYIGEPDSAPESKAPNPFGDSDEETRDRLRAGVKARADKALAAGEITQSQYDGMAAKNWNVPFNEPPPNIIALPSLAPPAAEPLPSAMDALAALRRESVIHILPEPEARSQRSDLGPQTSDPQPWGEVIYAYSRAQAIEDGVLVDAMTGDLEEISRQHYKYPIAMTSAVWQLIEAALDKPGQDIKLDSERGRGARAATIWHDILWMSKKYVTQRISESIVLFQLSIARRKHTLKLIVGPGDTPAPVITILLPDED